MYEINFNIIQLNDDEALEKASSSVKILKYSHKIVTLIYFSFSYGWFGMLLE